MIEHKYSPLYMITGSTDTIRQMNTQVAKIVQANVTRGVSQHVISTLVDIRIDLFSKLAIDMVLGMMLA